MNYANSVNWKYTMLNIKEIRGLSGFCSMVNFSSGYTLQVRHKTNAQKASAGFPLLSRSFSAVSPLFTIKTTKHQYE